MTSNDTKALMLFMSNKKSVGVAYLLWFFLGLVGGHNFYCGRIGCGVAQLLITLFGGLITFGFAIFITLIWAIIDAFLIPGWIRNHNEMLATSLGATV